MLFKEHVFSGHLPHRHTDQVVSIFTLILKRLDLIQTVYSRTDTRNSESNHSAHYVFGCTAVPWCDAPLSTSSQHRQQALVIT